MKWNGTEPKPEHPKLYQIVVHNVIGIIFLMVHTTYRDDDTDIDTDATILSMAMPLVGCRGTHNGSVRPLKMNKYPTDSQQQKKKRM